MRRPLVIVLLAGLAISASASFMAFAQVAPPPPPQAGPPPPPPPFGFGGRGGGRGGPPQPINLAQIAALKTNYARPAAIPSPADNPSTPAKLALGQKLFFDPGVSANGRLACASCHDARRGFSDGLSLSVGVKGTPLSRHTPTAMNLAFSPALFWDGRARTLEEQAVMPIANEDEMGMPHGVLAAKLQLDPAYQRMFAEAFPGQNIDATTIGAAIAVFERSLTFTSSPFDRWLAGDETAISDQAKRGFVQFNTGGCAQCHSGWNFTDGKFHDIGLLTADTGRFAIEANEALRFAFKTPSLRNVATQAPYMHNGLFVSLQQVVRFYNNGFIRRPSLAPEMRNVRAGRGAGDIVSFLQTLTSPIPAEFIAAQEALDRQVGRGGGVVAVAGP